MSGQLYGFCGVDETPACGDQVGSTLMYGEFETTWNDTVASYWLTLGGTIWVNSSAITPGNGQAAFPFPTVNDGNNLAWANTRLVVLAGSYDETVTFSTPMTISAAGGTATIGQ